jgi:hypothetical protein
MFENTKGVIIIHQSKRDRQYNEQKKKNQKGSIKCYTEERFQSEYIRKNVLKEIVHVLHCN